MVRNLRAHQVAMMLARVVEEGLRLEKKDEIILNAYARGTVSSVDMIAHARQFLTIDSYHGWMVDRGTLLGEANLTFSVAQVLEEFYCSLQRRFLEGEP